MGWAGGPLVVGLILGYMGRTGPFVWQMPYTANLTLRQFGLILFLAGLGTHRGWAFRQTFLQEGGPEMLLLGAAITFTAALLTLVIGYRLLKLPMSLLSGILSGLQTQPALLAFTLEQSKNEAPNVGFAAVYPVATVAKILLAQLLLIL